MLLIGPAVVLGAFLLFLVQPLAGKQLLPLFGGSSAIWSACLLFFQSVLLVGYLYSHALTRRLRPVHQALVHAAVALVCAFVPRASLNSGGSSVNVLATLATAVGLPYLLLATTSPLLQHWHALLHPGGRPYRLSAFSNAACAAALLGFPFFLEPRFGTASLDRLWNWGFRAECLLLILVAAQLYRTAPQAPPRALISNTPVSLRLAWIAWPALGSAFLMATSTHLCQVVAPAPLLWVAPMLVYLFSFVAVFAADTYDTSRGASRAMLGLLAMAACVLYLDFQPYFLAKVALYCLGLGLVCLFSHGELAALKPAPDRLTSYWVHVATGGALGSLLVAFLSPALLKGYFELPTLMAGAGALCLFRLRRSSRLGLQAAGMAAVVVATPILALASSYYSGLVEAGRNFYGSLRVLDEPASPTRPALRKLLNGLVTHGSQFLDPADRLTPTAYYGGASGIGLLLGRPAPPRRVGVIGLGAGTLAAYGRPGDSYDFFEINPLVIDMARRDFQFLAASPAVISVIEGDARLSLASAPPKHYDVLVVDAFSGDSIPAHLLTREAFALYLSHLRPGGMLALHVSNQYLDLTPAVRALAADAGRPCARMASAASQPDATLAAVWMMVENTPTRSSTPQPFPVWTDDWNSLLPALR